MTTDTTSTFENAAVNTMSACIVVQEWLRSLLAIDFESGQDWQAHMDGFRDPLLGPVKLLRDQLDAIIIATEKELRK